MKHLLTGVAVIAALAFSAPVGAQPASPSGGNALGLPGPNPGGPGLTPYSSGPLAQQQLRRRRCRLPPRRQRRSTIMPTAAHMAKWPRITLAGFRICRAIVSPIS